MSQASAQPTAAELGISERYRIRDLLGRGGMASVYHADDLATGRAVALKQLILPEDPDQRERVRGLFEHEFHTLVQLKHPRVVTAFDYGVSATAGPYYTMELLDGGDMRQRTPLPWREACALSFDVCSSLALLHSRRLVHRDVSPRNIHCTRDGRAKLIDFGAMAPMGAVCATVVGTPAFTPPEAVQRSTLDARSDLYSLGASLYYALCGRVPYAARSFAELLDALTVAPPAPSQIVPQIPAALDELVLSLLNVEPALRPSTAYDVMQRLAAIGGFEYIESEGVSRAYLATPLLIGQDRTLRDLRERIERAKRGQGSAVLISAAEGLGRSRLLDASALEAKLLGALVLRANPSHDRRNFATTLDLLEHLLEALPNDLLLARFGALFEPTPALPDAPLGQVRARLRRELERASDSLHESAIQLFMFVSERQPLVIAVDDVHAIDESSAALIAALIERAPKQRLCVALTAPKLGDQEPLALSVLRRRCELQTLEPLTQDQTRQLLASLFGEVEHLALLAHEVYQLARGNPRECLDLAQHLVDRRVIRYAAGTWTLPGRLSGADLPRSAEATISARVELLSALACELAEAQALAFFDSLRLADYQALAPEVEHSAVDAAVSELLAAQVLSSDGEAYTLSHRGWGVALRALLSPEQTIARHRALARMYQGQSHPATIHHMFAGGLDEQGLDLYRVYFADMAKRTDHIQSVENRVGRLAPTYPRALDAAVRLKRSARELNELRRWCVATMVAGTSTDFERVAPPWLAQLAHDSGLELWRADGETEDAGARLTRALQRAYERYAATPVEERVYAVDEAIRLLAEYVVYSIVIGVRTFDLALLNSLPPLLEPFAPLSPVLDALWQNSIATVASQRCQFEAARDCWFAAYQKLIAAQGGEMNHVNQIRNAVAFALAITETLFGIPTSIRWLDGLDKDPYQRVSALELRKVVCLEQGDWPRADEYQREAELAALQARTSRMFAVAMVLEISVRACARDLAGLKSLLERVKPELMAEPSYAAFQCEVEAIFQLVRGDLAAARAGFERAIVLAATASSGGVWSSVQVWIRAQAGLAETLRLLGQDAAALSGAREALETCELLQVGVYATELTRQVALAEAKLGHVDAANARIDRIIEKQRALGVAGMKLGLSYEARAQIAIWSKDEATFETYAKLTGSEFKHDTRCPLAVRYKRLVHEARRQGMVAAADGGMFGTVDLVSSMSSGMRAMSADQRCEHALRLVCETYAANSGYLYGVAESGAVLRAAFGQVAPPDDLSTFVARQLARENEESELMTVAVTGTVADGAPLTGRTTIVGGVEFQLLFLTGSVDGMPKLVGAVALAESARPMRGVLEAQLLRALAQQLVVTEISSKSFQ